MCTLVTPYFINPHRCAGKRSMGGFGGIAESRAERPCGLFGDYGFSKQGSTTVSKYVNVGRWKQWAQQYDGMVILPVNEAEFVLYLQHLGDTTTVGRFSGSNRFIVCGHSAGRATTTASKT